MRQPTLTAANCISPAGLSRWQRIAAVRDLSTAAAGEEDVELGKLGTRYARVAKASSEEQMKARRIAAQQIFERQVGPPPQCPLVTLVQTASHSQLLGVPPLTQVASWHAQLSPPLLSAQSPTSAEWMPYSSLATCCRQGH